MPEFPSAVRAGTIAPGVVRFVTHVDVDHHQAGLHIEDAGTRRSARGVSACSTKQPQLIDVTLRGDGKPSGGKRCPVLRGDHPSDRSGGALEAPAVWRPLRGGADIRQIEACLAFRMRECQNQRTIGDFRQQRLLDLGDVLLELVGEQLARAAGGVGDPGGPAPNPAPEPGTAAETLDSR